MNQEIPIGSIWNYYEKGKFVRRYCVLMVDEDGVIATSEIHIDTDREDSFSWLSPIDDFLKFFRPQTPLV
jgi:hypothetical protein